MKKLLFILMLVMCAAGGHAQIAVGDSLKTIINSADNALMDVDNDGDYDLIVVGLDEIVWYENEGGESFGAANSILPGITGNKVIYAEDFNGDGFMDFTAHCTYGTEQIGWLENMGDGTFTLNTIVEANIENYTMFDADMDGNADLFYSTNSGFGVYKMMGNPDGTFDAEETVNDESYNYYGVYHTDFNNDGMEDLLYVTQDPTMKLNYCENEGGGVFAAPAIVLDDLLEKPEIAAFSDMDNDGDEDWILGFGWDIYGLHYYENIGAALGPDVSLMEYSYGGIAVGDLDLDGFNDIVAMASKRQHKWFKNNGDNTFEESETLPTTIWAETGWLSGLGSVHLYDFDEDGDLDIYGETVQDYFAFVGYTNLTIHEYQASGSFFLDVNENGVRDIDEEGAGFADIGCTPDPEGAYVNPEGDYFVSFPIEDDITYTISPVLPPGWEVSTPDPEYIILVDGVTPWENLDFGIYPNEEIDTIGSELAGGFPRCNDTIIYWVNIDNFGTTNPNGIISLTLDDSLAYVSSIYTPDSIIDQTIYWSYDALGWFENLQIPVLVATPDFLSEGDLVTSYLSASILNEFGEISFSTNDSLSQVIVCAYDPNDKVGFPYGVDEAGYVSMDQPFIDYTIRFQNTGTDTAFTVRIADQLDANLDWGSFQILGKSHDMEWTLDADGNVEFLFEDIALPDSNVNVIASQGYVKYRVDLEEGLPAETILENTGYIYFDLNPAIITNTTTHTLFDCESLLSTVSLPETVCHGDSIIGTTGGEEIPSTTVYQWEVGEDLIEGGDFAYLEMETGLHEIQVNVSTGFCEAANSYFVEVLEEIETTTLPVITICSEDSVAVFGTYENEAGIYFDTLSAVLYGCDSIIKQELMVYEEIDPTDLSEVFICNGDSVEIFGIYRHESGIYTEVLASAITGCDSMVTQSLTVYEEITPTELPTIGICAGENVEIFGEIENEAGVYTQVLASEETGCDSVVIQELVIHEITETYINELEDDYLCVEEAAIELSGVPAGGTFEGTGISGDYFDPLLAGDGDFTIYYNYEDDNGCLTTDSVTIIVVVCLGTSELDNTEFTIYPNPFSDVATLKFTRHFNPNESIQVIDLQGKVRRTYQNLSGNELKIEKGTLSTGVYFIQLLDEKGDEKILSRIIVE